MLTLTPRLQVCASQVPKGAIPCDIGTDHATLLAWLVEQGICEKAYGTDIHEGPLQAARATLEATGTTEKVALYCCDGLTALEQGSITHAIVAGMGGETIVHILEDCQWRNQLVWILQPMTRQETLRVWLAENGFEQHETIVREGNRFYHIITASYVGEPQQLSAIVRQFGLTTQQEDAVGYAKKTMAVLQERIANIQRESQADFSSMEQQFKQLENWLKGEETECKQ